MQKCTVADGKPALVFGLHPVQGRGTTRRIAFDKGGNPVLVKDSWRSSGGVTDSETLEALGSEGVDQTVAYQEDANDAISNLRKVEGCSSPYADEAPNPQCRNRTFSPIVMKTYGETIEHFDDQLQLLYAFRDAVCGHRSLLEQGKVLHRGVCVNNVLLGKKNAPIGSRGILIDFDLTIHIDCEASLSGAGLRTGTRAFQSVTVISRASSKDPPHDHLDDLESFFYILAWICTTYTGPHQQTAKPNFLANWDNPDASIAAAMKHHLLLIACLQLTPYFRPFKTLIRNLGRFLEGHVVSKISNEESPPKTLTEIFSEAGAHYDTYLNFVDKTIAELEASTRMAPATPPRQCEESPTREDIPPTSPIHMPVSAKRRAEESDLELPSGKRSKTDPVPNLGSRSIRILHCHFPTHRQSTQPN